MSCCRDLGWQCGTGRKCRRAQKLNVRNSRHFLSLARDDHISAALKILRTSEIWFESCINSTSPFKQFIPRPQGHDYLVDRRPLCKMVVTLFIWRRSNDGENRRGVGYKSDFPLFVLSVHVDEATYLGTMKRKSSRAAAFCRDIDCFLKEKICRGGRIIGTWDSSCQKTEKFKQKPCRLS